MVKIVNKKAKFEYSILEKLVAGIVLQGSEVKSIRAGKCNISDAYCYIHDREIFVKNMHISKYDSDMFTNHDELRDKKLLLTKKEIQKWSKEILTPGHTIIPLCIFINQYGLVKAEVGLCKGKKEFDKRQSIKENDARREIERNIKTF